jgi:hypothetical protein
MKRKINPHTKYELLSILAPYVKPQQIKQEFDIPYSTLNHYCKEYQIPKWQKSYSERKQEHKKSFKETEDYNVEVRLRMARELYERDGNITDQ